MASPVVHIVLFKFKSSLKEEEETDLCRDLLSLQHRCLHPTSQKPYIVSASGGKDNSPEGLQGGFTHGFVIEFPSKEDRDYYVSTDPEHQRFVRDNSAKFEDVRVLDYDKGAI